MFIACTACHLVPCKPGLGMLIYRLTDFEQCEKAESGGLGLTDSFCPSEPVVRLEAG